MNPRDREVLDYSLRRRVPDGDLATIFGVEPPEVARLRAGAVERLSDRLGVERGEDLGLLLKRLLEAETWALLPPAEAPPEPAGPAPAKPKPVIPEPEGSKPGAAPPAGQKPGATTPPERKPDAAKPEGARPDAAKPEGAKRDAAKPEGVKPDIAKPEGSKLGDPKPAAEPGTPPRSKPHADPAAGEQGTGAPHARRWGQFTGGEAAAGCR